MSYFLTIIMCSAVANQCLTPFMINKHYKDGYDCMIDGYKISHEKIVEIGREEINKSKIYIKFGCNEDNSNKTPTSYIIIR